MRHLPVIIALATSASFLSACSEESGQRKEARDNDAKTSADTTALDARGLIMWKYVNGHPMLDSDIDTIIDYLARADAWTRLRLKNVETEQQFDELDAAYRSAFPYIEDFSEILEQYAPAISESQMKRMQQIALSMGNAVDSVATALGMTPPSH